MFLAKAVNIEDIDMIKHERVKRFFLPIESPIRLRIIPPSNDPTKKADVGSPVRNRTRHFNFQKTEKKNFQNLKKRILSDFYKF